MQSDMDNALTDEVKEEIRQAYKSIQRNVKGFRERKSQLRLIAEVARTLAGFYGVRRIMAVEAPTGTGKSIGYMLGAIPVAVSFEKRLIIATGTVALQEQLVNRDIPSLRESSGLEFSYVLAKGRGRYACNRNVAELTNSDARQTSLLEGDDLNQAAWPFVPKPEQVKLVQAMEDALENDEWSGDLDEWNKAPIDDAMRPLLITDHGGCLGRNCPHFSKCGYQNARAKMREATVIVANHDLVMSDISLGGGAILPSPKDSMYVFDEAHHLPDVALAHGADESSIPRTIDTIARSAKVVSEAQSALKMKADDAKVTLKMIRDLVESLTESLKHCQTFLEDGFPKVETGFDGKRKGGDHAPLQQVWRFPGGELPKGLDVIGNSILTQASALAQKIEALLTRVREAFRGRTIEPQIANKVGKNLNFHLQRINSLVNTWILMLSETEPGSPPIARWIVREEGTRRGTANLTVCCSPTSAASMLQAIWNESPGVILASATLTALGNFNRFAERAGLSLRDGTQYLQLASPFDHNTNGELYIPFMASDPSDPGKHTEEVVSLLNSLVDDSKGSLVLFSARKQMLQVVEKIDPALRKMLLIQGEMSKNEILELHADRIKKGHGSIIFGLASFSEGVDLPGKLCEEVFIAKIPFAVPDSPVDATYSEWLESEGRNPFMEIAVPDACTKLIQSCGRLIRTETDSGRITLLDRRVITKRYGSQMLNSLPPFRRVVEREKKIA